MTSNEYIHVKSYFATNIPDAIEMARKELGADALLLNSRKAPPEARHLGAVEVVFGVHAEPRDVEPPPPASPASSDDLRRTMDEIRSLLIRSSATPSSRDRSQLVEQALLDAGLPPV